MPRLTIDGQSIDAPAGATILQAAESLGISIPTLCHVKGMLPSASCFACAVEVQGMNRLLPSCAAVAVEGMVVLTQSPAARAAQRRAVELLLSDHLGECQAPCELACPAHWDVAQFMAVVREGDLPAAARLARTALVLPGVLGYVCPAPCQKACRRREGGDAVAIRGLHRFAAQSSQEVAPAAMDAKRVAVVGAGPSGLAAAMTLLARGFACTVFDANSEPGGSLLALSESELPRSVLQREIEVISRARVEFRLEQRVGQTVSLAQLRQEFVAVILAAGENAAGLPAAPEEGIFSCGAMAGEGKLAIRAIASGQAAAKAVEAFLAGAGVEKGSRPVSLRYGPLEDDERELLWRRAVNLTMTTAGTIADAAGGVDEANRCLLCGCRENTRCRLRAVAGQVECATSGFTGERRRLMFDESHPQVLYEPHKCILCGACVAIAQQAGEELAIVGRGFSARVAGPMDAPLGKCLSDETAIRCAGACPTSAITRKHSRMEAAGGSKGSSAT